MQLFTFAESREEASKRKAEGDKPESIPVSDEKIAKLTETETPKNEQAQGKFSVKLTFTEFSLNMNFLHFCICFTERKSEEDKPESVACGDEDNT